MQKIKQNFPSSRRAFLERSCKGLIYYTIPAFEQTGLVKHGFSTRLGGVSKGEFYSLNLSFRRKDSPENVRENYKRYCRALEIQPEQAVVPNAVHGNRVTAVNETHRGMGITRQSEIWETDGLITNRPGLALVSWHADCVPLFFLDPLHKVIGLSHSGWRGTVAKIGQRTLKAMREHYGTRAEDCLVGIGPSIGPCCFEVDSPVANEFIEAWPEHKNEIVQPGEDGKFTVNLWEANRIQLEQLGVKKSHITTAALCTACNTDVFFSHRKEKGRTGSMAAVLMLV
ncbi:MAG: peptidoglycan editing factor PgeF [Caldicoprobacterales bacterium]|jgi:YfiH family protein|nr:peptidoglycan editing factor PgeF [Clostridiales bacterium]